MSMERDSDPRSVGGMSRRELLQRAGAAGVTFSAAGLLAACGGASPGGTAGGGTAGSAGTTAGLTPGSARVAGKPSRGGTLRVALVGNGNAETYNPGLAFVRIDYLHIAAVFDSLVTCEPYHRNGPGLAVSWEPNSDATVWVFKLRKDVTWHNGKPFTADDVIYSIRTMGQPGNAANSNVAHVNLRDLKKLDTHTVQVPLKFADATFYVNMSGSTSQIIPDGFTAGDIKRQPIGTGPYKLQSFTPGDRSVLTANRSYWDSPKPYPDELQIISINDDTARLNALQGGQVDMDVDLVSETARAAINNSGSPYVVVLGGPTSHHNIYMRVDKAPFDDPRVRKAIRLVANRQQLLDVALDGLGVVANDMMGIADPLYPKDLPQLVPDVEKAKALLKSAGHSDLRLTLDTSPVTPATVPAAQVFAQQAKAAGISIQLRQRTPASYYDTSQLYLKLAFAQDYWAIPSMKSYFESGLVHGANIDETHWDDPATNKLVPRAIAERDESKARELWHQIQQIQYDRGPQIVWGAARLATGVAHKVRGFGGPGHGVWDGPDDYLVANWGLA